MRIIKLCVVVCATLAVLFETVACTKQEAKSAVDVATDACKGETASVAISRDEAGNIVKTVCVFEEEVAPFIEGVLSARKTGAKYHPAQAPSTK